MPKAAVKNTVYGAYIRETVLKLIGAGQYIMTVDDIATAASLKVTVNLRRQVHKLVRDGVLDYGYPYSSGAGRKQQYVPHSVANELPF